MECPECGSQASYDSRACEKCGGSLVDVPPGEVSQLFAKPEKPRSYVWMIVVILGAIFIYFGHTLGSRKGLASLSPADIAKQVGGAEPIDTSLDSDDFEALRAFRDAVAQMQAFQKSQAEKAAALQPDLASIYSPESFSSAQRIQKTIDALNGDLVINEDSAAALRNWPVILRASIERSRLSTSDKQDLSQLGSDMVNSDSVKASQQSLAAEFDWVNATLDLYAYALQHAPQIAVQNGRIGIGDAQIRSQFNQKLAQSKSQHETFLLAFNHVNELRSRDAERMGVPLNPPAAAK